MTKKVLIYVPLVFFIGATVVLGYAILQQRNGNRIAIPEVLLDKITPVVSSQPTASPSVVLSPIPIDPTIQIGNDLNSIYQDIGKLKVEDTRFKPPTFVFDLGVQ